ncbi:MAG: DUF6438 domain-containing protein [Methanothrix sp.]|nr:DUF6438 domain-containing protein [Methanothrix sp.]
MTIGLSGTAAFAESVCPVGATHSTWEESLLFLKAKVDGCLGGDGQRIGPVVAKDAQGREILRGSYRDGLRSGAWTITMFSEQATGQIDRRRYWFDRGVNLALAGGELTKLVSARAAEAVKLTDVEERPPIHSLAIERLRVGFCKDCLSYSVRIQDNGRVEYTGFSGTDLMGPHCGTLDRLYTEAILGIAERANLKELADSYRKPVTDGGRLVVCAKWIATEKLVSVDGGAIPVLDDLATIVELAIDSVHWGCK